MSGAQGTAVITRKGQGWEEGLHPDRKGLSLKKKKKKKNLLPPPSFQLLNVVGGGEAMPRPFLSWLHPKSPIRAVCI